MPRGTGPEPQRSDRIGWRRAADARASQLCGAWASAAAGTKAATRATRVSRVMTGSGTVTLVWVAAAAPPMPQSVVVVAGGPAGLMAAEVLAEAGARVDLFDAMTSVGRKFLLA